MERRNEKNIGFELRRGVQDILNSTFLIVSMKFVKLFHVCYHSWNHDEAFKNIRGTTLDVDYDEDNVINDP